MARRVPSRERDLARLREIAELRREAARAIVERKTIILRRLEVNDCSQVELAEAAGVTKGIVTQILAEQRATS